MNTYRFLIQVYQTVGGATTPLTALSGTVRASRYSDACIRAWLVINKACSELKGQGLDIGTGNIHVQMEGTPHGNM